ncbi:MAG: ATP-binding cassette domain-containing protein [Acidimicrobiales bacterium]
MFGVAVESIMTILRLAVIGLGAWLIFEGRFTLGGLGGFPRDHGRGAEPRGRPDFTRTVDPVVGRCHHSHRRGARYPAGARGCRPAIAGPNCSRDSPRRRLTVVQPERRALDEVDVTIPAGSSVALRRTFGLGQVDDPACADAPLRARRRAGDHRRRRCRRSLTRPLRSQMGVVFQDSFLFDATVRENIALGSVGATEDEILAAADAAEVDSFVGNLARGYDTLVGESGRNLSGGQRQRVAIARALVGNPSILLLDEATSALDPGTERQISGTLERAGAGRTVVAITHRLTSVTDYDRIYVVDAGKIAEHGRHDELVALGGLYARLWAEQTGEPVPERPPFDLQQVLAKLPLFVDLEPDQLADLAARFGRVVVAPGSSVSEGGQLVVVADGRGELVSDEGAGAPSRMIASGEVFGLNALLGTPTGVQLRGAGTLDALDPARGLTRGTAPAVPRDRRAARGRSTMAATPGGRLLVRSTVGPVSSAARATMAARQEGISAADVAAVVAAARSGRSA